MLMGNIDHNSGSVLLMEKECITQVGKELVLLTEKGDCSSRFGRKWCY